LLEQLKCVIKSSFNYSNSTFFGYSVPGRVARRGRGRARLLGWRASRPGAAGTGAVGPGRAASRGRCRARGWPDGRRAGRLGGSGRHWAARVLQAALQREKGERKESGAGWVAAAAGRGAAGARD
jgi:hypothetical protein